MSANDSEGGKKMKKIAVVDTQQFRLLGASTIFALGLDSKASTAGGVRPPASRRTPAERSAILCMAPARSEGACYVPPPLRRAGLRRASTIFAALDSNGCTVDRRALSQREQALSGSRAPAPCPLRGRGLVPPSTRSQGLGFAFEVIRE